MLIFVKLIVLLSLFGDGVIGKVMAPIGAIFDENNVNAELAFQSVIFRENMYNKDVEFVPKVVKVSVSDTFSIEKQVCELLSEGVVAIFGPNDRLSNGIVSSMCDVFHIPHFTTNWMVSEDTMFDTHKFTRNFFPESNAYSRALAEIVVNFGWTSFTVLYDSKEGLMRLQDIVQINGPDNPPITVQKLDDITDFRPLLKDIHKNGETHIVIDCDTSKIIEIFRQANEVKMMEEYQNYFITTTDAHMLDFFELKFVRANISTIRLVDPNSVEATIAVQDWNQNSFRSQSSVVYLAEEIQTDAALIHDSVKMFANVATEIDELNPVPLRCNGKNSWSQGEDIMKAFDEKTNNGITGRILFDEVGHRSHFTMDVLEMSKTGFRKIAYWDSTQGVTLTRDLSEVYSKISESLHNKTVIVATIFGMPFFKNRTAEEGEVLEGNDRYEGYSVDLIDMISKVLGFKYQFEVVPDGRGGSLDKKTNKWNGVVRQLLDRKADMGICDLTITYERRTAVDFTNPFMTLGVSILFAKPIKQPPKLFSFLEPLSSSVWIYMGAGYLGVSMFLYMLARAAPDDWEAAHPCEKDPEEVENAWTFLNCTWLTVGSIMGQGCDILPKAISTRLVAGMWWFFALIMLSSYTANLAAFLTKEQLDAKIESAEDLAKQSKIKYGVMSGGSTQSFFETSNFSLYQRMWSAMESAEPSVFVASNKDGEERVAKSKRKYAFLMESSSIEYIVARNCNLTQIGGLLDSKGYGIAMPVNSPYRTHVSQIVLKMAEDGKLQKLKTKWWKEIDAGNCEQEKQDKTEGASKLGIGNVGGVFVVLALGCSCASILGIVEFLWNVKDLAIQEKISLYDALKMELLFALNFTITSKPVFSNPSKSPTPSEDIEDSHQSTDTLNTMSKFKG
ncbi:glutamate receptor ionotropic, kainate 2-like [Bradysia coprophila]|uniref:glutamate receptor ionotropic, kainate 2-like n=1 Tax=Bradysia coprophila TaxID=38358 RepID=UPI00187DA6C5|nr:glutamate receptor ionotropic, kainate 2-like [Bradysia coprophila]